MQSPLPPAGSQPPDQLAAPAPAGNPRQTFSAGHETTTRVSVSVPPSDERTHVTVETELKEDPLDPKVSPPTEEEIALIGPPPQPGEESVPLELPPRPRSSIASILLATIAVAVLLWATREIVLPILLAGFFALIGNPMIRLLRKLQIPRSLAAVLVVAGGIALAVSLGSQVVQPAAEWVRALPQQAARMAPKLRALSKPMQEANRVAENIAKATGTPGAPPTQVMVAPGNDPMTTLARQAPKYITQILAVVLLTLFFMIFGDTLQKHVIDLLPSWRKKRLTVDILQSIEREMSRYVMTISIINTLMGLAFALLLHLIVGTDLQTALLWGTMAALLNFAPYAGPLIGVAVMLVMGFATQNNGLHALIPATVYLGLHTLEGQIITPIILGKRMAISPLLLMVALLVFGWGWGIVGLLLAVPLLVCLKIILSKLDGREPWAKLME